MSIAIRVDIIASWRFCLARYFDTAALIRVFAAAITPLLR